MSQPRPWLLGGALALGGALWYRFSYLIGMEAFAAAGPPLAGLGLLWISLAIRHNATSKNHPTKTL